MTTHYVAITDRLGPNTRTVITKFTDRDYQLLKSKAADKLSQQLFDGGKHLPFGTVDFNVVSEDLRLQIFQNRYKELYYNMYFPFTIYEGAIPFKVWLEKSWEY